MTGKRALLSIIVFCLLQSLFNSPAIGQESTVDSLELARMTGKQVYDAFCSRCHGADGRGQISEELAANFEAPVPDFHDRYFSSREKRKDWFNVIKFGGVARGLSMSMPSWGEVLSDRQIDELVEHIKSYVDQSRYPQGETNFIRAHGVTKAFVEQEALLIPTYKVVESGNVTTTDAKITAYYADRIGERFQYEVKIPYRTLSSGERRSSGIAELELGLKYAFYDNYKSLTLMSAGVEAAIPAGGPAGGLRDESIVMAPYFAIAQGVGEKVQLQGSLALHLPFGEEKPEFRYGFSATLALQEGKQGVFPGIEILGRKKIKQSNTQISIVPRIFVGLSKRGHVAFSLGPEIPIGGEKPFKYSIVAFLLWEYVEGPLF